MTLSELSRLIKEWKGKEAYDKEIYKAEMRLKEFYRNNKRGA